MTRFDTIVIGGGHNGLVASNLIAREGRSVLLCEARGVFGGLMATEEGFEGVQVPVGACDVSLLRAKVIDALELPRYGLETFEPAVSIFVPAMEGTEALRLARDPGRGAASLSSHSPSDANRWPEFLNQVGALSAELEPMLEWTPQLQDLGHLVRSPELMRFLTLSARELLDNEFESERLKGALAWRAVLGGSFGPMSGGTGLALLYQLYGTSKVAFGPLIRVEGGMQAAVEALEKSAAEAGVDMRSEAPVARILVEGSRAVGVELENGESLEADMVVSAIDPRSTLLGLVGPKLLAPSVVRALRTARYRGTTARLDLLLSVPPTFKGMDDEEALSARIVVSPDLETLERASDAAKYGRYSTKPCFELMLQGTLSDSPEEGRRCVASVTAQFAPFGADKAQRAAFVASMLEQLERVAPGFGSLIEQRRLRVADDWQTDFGLTQGNIFHGEMTLDQMMTLRPVPGYARYNSPIEGLFLCSAGTHPGGGVTGLPAWNAVREILRFREESR